ncbi:MAG TPA: aminoacyl-tRNA hydrolase, partial [Candidatus Goldiibacteriota bacterium]|nr:aminoacyl-tRNA hydrolase [Candidatus Goldiibacteriota bacterium]
MKLIAGLGNHGKQYENTRHNMGYMFADHLAASLKLKFKKADRAQSATGEISGQKFILLKPETYMNLSGTAVAPVAAYKKIIVPDILIVHDDIDLPELEIRIKKGGGDGGHNGLKSITEALGDNGYIRVRIGVSRPENPAYDTADWVLGKLPEEKLPELEEKFRAIEKFVSDWLAEG